MSPKMAEPKTISPCPVCRREYRGQGSAYFGPACSAGDFCCTEKARELSGSCGSCPEWRKDLGGRKACLNQDSPRYQSYTKAEETCGAHGGSTTCAAVFAELRRREALSAKTKAK
jgi:hypothetical protein